MRSTSALQKRVPYCCLRKYILSVARKIINLINEICDQNAATCNCEAFWHVWQTFCREVYPSYYLSGAHNKAKGICYNVGYFEWA